MNKANLKSLFRGFPPLNTLHKRSFTLVTPFKSFSPYKTLYPLQKSPFSIVTSTPYNLLDIFPNLSSPLSIADFFLQNKASLSLDPEHLLLEILPILNNFPLDECEKLPLNFLLVLLADLSKLPPSKQKEIGFTQITPFLTLQMQKQDFEGFYQLVQLLKEEPLMGLLEESEGFLLKIIEENYTYFAMACSLDFKGFLQLAELLYGAVVFKKIPYKVLIEGFGLKAGNRLYSKGVLSLEEVHLLLKWDKEFLNQRNVLLKLEEFLMKSPDSVKGFALEEVFSILEAFEDKKWEYNIGLLEGLEALALEKLPSKGEKLGLMLLKRVLGYLSKEKEGLGIDYLEGTIPEIEALLKIGEKEILPYLEIVFEVITKEKRQEIGVLLKEKELLKGLSLKECYIGLLYTGEFDLNKGLSLLKDLQGKDDLIELSYAAKCLNSLKNKGNQSKNIKEYELLIEFLLNNLLSSKNSSLLLKQPFEFLDVLSLQRSLFPSKNTKFLSELSLKGAGLHELALLQLAAKKHLFFHEFLLKDLEKELKTQSELTPFDLKKLKRLSSDLIAFKTSLLQAKLGQKIEDKRYIARFQAIIGVIQEGLLLKVLSEGRNKAFIAKPNVFERFEKETSVLKGKKNEVNPTFDDKKELIFLDLTKEELFDILTIAKAFIKVNMGTLPIYYMFWKLIERFYKEIPFSDLIEWLYLLGNGNRLPKEFPIEIEAFLNNEENSRFIKGNLEFQIKSLWVMILKNPEEIPLKSIDILTNLLKEKPGDLNRIPLEIKARLYQILMLLSLQEIKPFDQYLGLSQPALNRLKTDYKGLLKEQQTPKNAFKTEIEFFLKKHNIAHTSDIILELKGLLLLKMDIQLEKGGFLYIQDARSFLGTSNIELIEGWLLRKIIKNMSEKVKFLDFSVFFSFERRHEKNSYIRQKVKGLGIDVIKNKNSYFDF